MNTFSLVYNILESFHKKKINEARRMRRTRKVADKQPEVYILGEILGGSGFGKGVSCVWQVQPGSNWNYYDGVEQGQTHYDYPGKSLLLSLF